MPLNQGSVSSDLSVQTLDLTQQLGAHLFVRNARAWIGSRRSDSGLKKPALGLKLGIDLGNGLVQLYIPISLLHTSPTF